MTHRMKRGEYRGRRPAERQPKAGGVRHIAAAQNTAVMAADRIGHQESLYQGLTAALRASGVIPDGKGEDDKQASRRLR